MSTKPESSTVLALLNHPPLAAYVRQQTAADPQLCPDPWGGPPPGRLQLDPLRDIPLRHGLWGGHDHSDHWEVVGTGITRFKRVIVKVDSFNVKSPKSFSSLASFEEEYYNWKFSMTEVVLARSRLVLGFGWVTSLCLAGDVGHEAGVSADYLCIGHSHCVLIHLNISLRSSSKLNAPRPNLWCCKSCCRS